jgi:hypothetical protein
MTIITAALMGVGGYMAKNRYIPLNCSKCGCFVGKNGFHDVGYDYWNGGYEAGYPLCKKCLDRSKAKNAKPKQSNRGIEK